MAVNIQLKEFTVKTSPVPADLVYSADSANNYDEVQITIAELINAYPALSSIANLTTTANEIIYTTDSDTYTTAPITAFGLSVLALSGGVTTPTAGDFATWDTNSNLSANNFLPGFTAIASAASTTVLTVASTEIQQITGSTTQILQMPVVSTLKQGQSFIIINSSTGNVTVNSSGGNLIGTLSPNTLMTLTCILTSGTNAASWYAEYVVSGAVNSVAGDSGSATPSSGSLTLTGGTTGLTFTGSGNTLTLDGILTSAFGGTGVDNGVNTFTYSGNVNFSGAFTTTGAFAVDFTFTATTNLTFPTSGTLATTITPATWTPVITFDTPGNLSVSYTTQVGYYTRVGNIVHVEYNIDFSPTFTTASGNLRVTGLPVTLNASAPYAMGNLLIQPPTFPVGCTSVFTQAVPNNTYFVIGANGSAVAAAYFTVTQITSGGNYILTGSFSYLV